MPASDQYNHDLYGLPISQPAILNINYLTFLRQLAVRGALEHPACGPADGPALALVREYERVSAARGAS